MSNITPTPTSTDTTTSKVIDPTPIPAPVTVPSTDTEVDPTQTLDQVDKTFHTPITEEIPAVEQPVSGDNVTTRPASTND